MEANLLGILATRKPAFSSFLSDPGLGSWSSGQKMLESYEAAYGKLPAEEAFQLAMNRNVQALVAERGSGQG